MCAVLSAVNSMNYIPLFLPGCFVLRMDMFLPQRVGGLKVNQDMMFIKKVLLSFSDVTLT